MRTHSRPCTRDSWGIRISKCTCSMNIKQIAADALMCPPGEKPRPCTTEYEPVERNYQAEPQQRRWRACQRRHGRRQPFPVVPRSTRIFSATSCVWRFSLSAVSEPSTCVPPSQLALPSRTSQTTRTQCLSLPKPGKRQSIPRTAGARHALWLALTTLANTEQNRTEQNRTEQNRTRSLWCN